MATFTNVCRRPCHRARASYVTGKTRTEERRSRPSQRHLPRGPQVACASPGGREARGQGGAPKRHELGSFGQLLLMVTRRVRRRGKFCRGWKQDRLFIRKSSSLDSFLGGGSGASLRGLLRPLQPVARRVSVISGRSWLRRRGRPHWTRTRTRGAPRSPRPFKPPGRVSAIVAGRSDQPRTEPFQAAFS